MKKIIVLLVLFSTTFLFSQNSGLQLGNVRFGVVGGPVYSRVKNAHNPSSARTSFYGGVLAIISMDKDDQFYIQPQIEYLSAGENGAGDTVYANNYISVPVYAKMYFSEAESEFFAFAGPRFGFLIGQNVKNPSRTFYNTDQGGKASGFDLALSGGVGYSYQRNFEINARVDFGLSNVFPNMIESQTGDPNTYSSKKQHIISLGLSYIFD